MSSIERKLIQPESILIEKTALEMAQFYYIAGRRAGLQSKHKDERSFARANVTTFIPMAVETLMDMLAKDSTPKKMKDAILDAFLERSNDQELSNIGIEEFKNPFAEKFTSDKVVIPPPIIVNTLSIEDALEKQSGQNLFNKKGKDN